MAQFLDDVFTDKLAYARFYDVLNEATYPNHKEYTHRQLREVFSYLPRPVQIDVLQWGFDTVVNDRIYDYILTHGLPND